MDGRTKPISIVPFNEASGDKKLCLTNATEFGHTIFLIYWPSIINFVYAIACNIFQNTTKRKELSSLKRTTFVYFLSSDWWIRGLTLKRHLIKMLYTSEAKERRFISPPDIPFSRPGVPINVLAHLDRPSCKVKNQ